MLEKLSIKELKQIETSDDFNWEQLVKCISLSNSKLSFRCQYIDNHSRKISPQHT